MIKIKSAVSLLGATVATLLLISYFFKSTYEVPPPCIDLGSGIGASRYYCFYNEPFGFIVGFLVFIGIIVYFLISAFEIKKSKK